MLFSGPTAARWNVKRPAGVWWEKHYRSTVSLRRNLTPVFLWRTPVMPRGSETKQKCTVLARVSVAILAQVLIIYKIVIRSSFGSSIYSIKRAFNLQCCVVLMSANGEQVYENSQWTNLQWQQQDWHHSDEDEAARLDWYNLTAWSRSQPSAANLNWNGWSAEGEFEWQLHWYIGRGHDISRDFRSAMLHAKAKSAPAAKSNASPPSQPWAAPLENSGTPADNQPWLEPSGMQLENERQAAAFANAVSVPPASSENDEWMMMVEPPTPTQHSQHSAASSSSDSIQPSAALRSISQFEQLVMRKTRHEERIDMTPAPRFAECDADEGRDFYCTSPVDPTYVWLDAGTEVEPAVGGMSLQSQPMPGSHPLLGQRPPPGQRHGAAVWPALEALSSETQLLIMKFAFGGGEFAFLAEDKQRYLRQNLSTLKMALLEGDEIEFLPPHIIVWYKIYDQTYAAPALGVNNAVTALAWLGAEDEVEPAVGGAEAEEDEEAEPALGGADVEPALNIDDYFGDDWKPNIDVWDRGRVYDERTSFIRHRWFRLATRKVWIFNHALFLAWYSGASARKRALRFQWAFLARHMLNGRAWDIANMPKIHLQLDPVRD
jgi:hypothetical protein